MFVYFLGRPPLPYSARHQTSAFLLLPRRKKSPGPHHTKTRQGPRLLLLGDYLSASDGSQARTLIEAQDARGVDDAMGFGEKVPENEIARGAGEPGAGIVAFDVRAGVLDEFSIFDAGGAGSFASAAVEAFVDVIDERFGDGLVVQFDLNHLVNAATGRIGFEVPQPIGGTGVEAEAAMDAAGIVLVNGNLARDSGRWHGQVWRQGTMIRPHRVLRKCHVRASG